MGTPAGDQETYKEIREATSQAIVALSQARYAIDIVGAGTFASMTTEERELFDAYCDAVIALERVGHATGEAVTALSE